MRLANPLYYPIPILIGAIALFVGVRVARLPSAVMVPVSVAIATLGASIRKSQEPEGLGLENPALERELKSVQNQAERVANQGEALRVEATRLLTELDELELLAIVQLACDRAKDLPAKVDQLARRLHGSDSLLSTQDLQRQFKEVEDKLHASSGVAREQLQQLADTLRRNIQLAQEGEDARQAQVVSLSTLILDAAGILQRLQNQLRTADLTDTSATSELRSLSNEFRHFQENVDLLLTDTSHRPPSNSQPPHRQRRQV